MQHSIAMPAWRSSDSALQASEIRSLEDGEELSEFNELEIISMHSFATLTTLNND